MKKSQFQFTNPILKQLRFTINDGFVVGEQLDMEIKISHRISYCNESDGLPKNCASVSVTISIGAQDNSTPFYIEAEETADFKWDCQLIDDTQAQRFLKQNAVALLIAYLRPIIANVTAASPFPAYNLPFINLVEEN